MFDLSGKTAFITGSARGIGLAAAETLVRAGAKVILHGIQESGHLKEVSARLAMPYVTGDLANPEEVRRMAQQVGAADILVLNGSVQYYGGLDHFNPEEFQKTMQANVAASFELVSFFAPKMAEKKSGRIIAVSSINQLRPASRLAVYAASKAALGNLMQMTAKKYAPEGITANTILPGVIETDRNRETLKEESFAESLKAAIPVRRFGTPMDCAPAVLFLASEEASYITGAEIPVAGGWQL